MTTPGRHQQIIERIMGLTGCKLQDITLNRKVLDLLRIQSMVESAP